MPNAKLASLVECIALVWDVLLTVLHYFGRKWACFTAVHIKCATCRTEQTDASAVGSTSAHTKVLF